MSVSCAQVTQQHQGAGDDSLDNDGHIGDLLLIQLGEALEEVALLGHGIVHSGLGQDEAVHAAEHGQNHAHGNHHGTCAAQQLLGSRRTQIQVAGVDHGGDLFVGAEPS